MSGMDDELIPLLCTRIGAFMEDTSVIALTLGPLSPGEKSKRSPSWAARPR